MKINEIYSKKDKEYFNQTRYDLIEHIPRISENKILEIGSGSGDTLCYLKSNGIGTEVVGIELLELLDSNQKNPLIDNFIIGNIETNIIPYPENYFDTIICGDVLEHLIDPWTVVEKVSHHLKVGGKFIICCPNISEIKTMYTIFFKGDFKYEESGILDKTHLRFFCKKNLTKLMNTKNLKHIITLPNYTIMPRRGKFKFLHFSLLDNVLCPQYIAISEKIK